MPETKELVTFEACCTYYDIEQSFVHNLHEYGLIEIISDGKKRYIRNAQLLELEKFIRLYYELGINMEGIDAIGHLLHRMQEMREEITQLKNKLHRWEDED